MPDYYQLDLWTSAPSSTSSQATSPDTNSVISSLGSAAGPMPSASLDGAARSGQEAVPVSRFQARRTGEIGGRTLKSIFGLLGFGSSLNVVLARSLVNRLPLPGIGSMAFAMTWKSWATP